jgi:hypothetical protein
MPVLTESSTHCLETPSEFPDFLELQWLGFLVILGADIDLPELQLVLGQPTSKSVGPRRAIS